MYLHLYKSRSQVWIRKFLNRDCNIVTHFQGLYLDFGCITCSYKYNMVFIYMLGRFLYIVWIQHKLISVNVDTSKKSGVFLPGNFEISVVILIHIFIGRGLFAAVISMTQHFIPISVYIFLEIQLYLFYEMQIIPIFSVNIKSNQRSTT